MTRYEQLTEQIESTHAKLMEIPMHSEEAATLRHEQTELLTTRMSLTTTEAQEVVE